MRMSNALGDLQPRDRFEEPPEVQIIKKFMEQNYRQEVGVSVQPGHIIIHVQGAALAGTLRMRLHELKELCQTDKRLIIRM